MNNLKQHNFPGPPRPAAAARRTEAEAEAEAESEAEAAARAFRDANMRNLKVMLLPKEILTCQSR